MTAPGPRLLRADNLTPPARTPWGGRAILDELKRGLDLEAAGAVAGESWEISVEPSFPSRTADTGELLADLIADAPAAWLGAHAGDGQTPLLVKLLDAGDDLSVQVHPAAGDPALAADESGKPEAWYVIGARQGAGLYLGFADGVERADVERCLAAGGALDELMNFAPVAPGDAFVIEAGTPHAIGAGVTLVEPQLVYPGRRGVTYRFWDWNRRYDPDGRRVEVGGAPRPLHVERSLAVTRWDAPRGREALEACRAGRAGEPRPGLTRAPVIQWRHFEVELWRGTGSLSVPAQGVLLALVCVGGVCELRTACGAVALRSGQSAVVPAAAGALELAGTDAHVVVTRRPA